MNGEGKSIWIEHGHQLDGGKSLTKERSVGERSDGCWESGEGMGNLALHCEVLRRCCQRLQRMDRCQLPGWLLGYGSEWDALSWVPWESNCLFIGVIS